VLTADDGAVVGVGKTDDSTIELDLLTNFSGFVTVNLEGIGATTQYDAVVSENGDINLMIDGSLVPLSDVLADNGLGLSVGRDDTIDAPTVADATPSDDGTDPSVAANDDSSDSDDSTDDNGNNNSGDDSGDDNSSDSSDDSSNDSSDANDDSSDDQGDHADNSGSDANDDSGSDNSSDDSGSDDSDSDGDHSGNDHSDDGDDSSSND
jgi:hypothetical protein